MGQLLLTQRIDVIEEYGETRDALDQAWTELLATYGHTPIPIPNQLADPTIFIEDIEPDGIILTGGNNLATFASTDVYPERDRVEKALLTYAIDNMCPVLGVCRGLQAINAFFDGGLCSVEGHVGTQHTIDIINDIGVWSAYECTEVNSYHGYGLQEDDVGSDLIMTAKATDGTIEAITHSDYPIVGIMWHPERHSPSASLDSQLLTTLFTNTCI